MWRSLLLVSSALLFCVVLSDGADAQRYGGAGFRGGGFYGGGYRAVGVGGGRWAAGAIGRPGWGAGYRPGWGGRWAGYRTGWRWAGYRSGWGNRPWLGAAGLGLASAAYYGSYYPYAYGAGGYYPYGYSSYGYGYNDCVPWRGRYAYY